MCCPAPRPRPPHPPVGVCGSASHTRQLIVSRRLAAADTGLSMALDAVEACFNKILVTTFFMHDCEQSFWAPLMVNSLDQILRRPASHFYSDCGRPARPPARLPAARLARPLDRSLRAGVWRGGLVICLVLRLALIRVLFTVNTDSCTVLV
jgi:hypothetical protein